ncbi:hypothetical protein SAMN05421786_108205 [Chryseobacterium ureilyticum]|uniref:DUF3806 domain-containing protein n=1 Tax=Chryseobacterium ureilyticum TaxID=373668 RepID=A0A1N7QB78_9FLAO|nr:hypothetical protein [Chryseobacterium ureilyticum]SIT20148.1 hypothetical protein SAMN05421786_108205 [Chryseobacterium ureilyticum]
MSYTQENFQEWIFFIGEKMDSFTEDFAKENNINLDYSIKSLDELEKWIINNYSSINNLKEDPKMLDLLTIYIGETFRKHLGGKWVMDTEDQDNAYYMMPVLTSPDYKGEVYKAPRTFATASIPRKKGNYISTILKNNMEDMAIPINE